MKRTKFETLEQAEQYCDGIREWDFGNGPSFKEIVSTCFNHNCCLYCALIKLNQNVEDYSREMECECSQQAKEVMKMEKKYYAIYGFNGVTADPVQVELNYCYATRELAEEALENWKEMDETGSHDSNFIKELDDPNGNEVVGI